VIRGVTRQYIDVLYPDHGVVVELDGILAHSADGTSRDMRRDNANTLSGYQTLRYGWTPVAYHACATAFEVFSLLRRNGSAAPFRPCGMTCTAPTPGSAWAPPAWTWTPPVPQPARQPSVPQPARQPPARQPSR
jgi:hypothetical protein